MVCLGDRPCVLCGGECCHLVNSVIDALQEEGDLDPNAEVCFYPFYCYAIDFCAGPEAGCNNHDPSLTQFKDCGI